MTRRSARFAAGLPAGIELSGKEHPCTAHNLSRTGVLLIGKLARPQESSVRAWVQSPYGDLRLAFRAKVARVERDEAEDELHLALEFHEMEAEQQATLEKLLARVIGGQVPGPIEALRPGAPPHEVVRALEQVPLPHRISLAARANLQKREILAQDRHPEVLNALARNPQLLVVEARTLASLPHLAPGTLEILAADPRWTDDDELRIAVASHPRAPLPLARKVAERLEPAALRKLAQRPGLNPTLRTELARRLARGSR